MMTCRQGREGRLRVHEGGERTTLIPDRCQACPAIPAGSRRGGEDGRHSNNRPSRDESVPGGKRISSPVDDDFVHPPQPRGLRRLRDGSAKPTLQPCRFSRGVPQGLSARRTGSSPAGAGAAAKRWQNVRPRAATGISITSCHDWSIASYARPSPPASAPRGPAPLTQGRDRVALPSTTRPAAAVGPGVKSPPIQKPKYIGVCSLALIVSPAAYRNKPSTLGVDRRPGIRPLRTTGFARDPIEA